MIMTNRCALNLSYCFTIISENHLRCGACSRHRWIWILTGSWILRTSCPCSCSWTSLGCSSSGPSDCAICFSTWILTPASPLPILISGCLRYLAPWTRFWRSPSRGCCDSFRLDCWLISAATQLCSNKSCPADFNWLSLSENISHLYYIIYQVGKWIILIRFFHRQKVQSSGRWIFLHMGTMRRTTVNEETFILRFLNWSGGFVTEYCPPPALRHMTGMTINTGLGPDKVGARASPTHMCNVHSVTPTLTTACHNNRQHKQQITNHDLL